MSAAKDIAEILSKNESFTLGENLFISQLPENPDEAVCVYEAGAGSYDAVAEISSATLTLKVRSTTYEGAYSMINLASSELSPIGDEKYLSEDLCTGYGVDENDDGEYERIYLRIAPNSEPYPTGLDSSERYEFIQSFTTTFCRL